MKIRMRFSKGGTLKFIGHLDVMRFFQKTFRRAQLDMIYSQGFNPHPLLSFASPLGVGLTSDGEYLDIQLNTCGTSKELMDLVNSALTSEGLTREITIHSVKKLPDDAKTSMALVAAADYRMDLKDGYESYMIPDFAEKFLNFLQQDSIVITKQTKKGEAEIDLKPWIYQVAFDEKDFSEKTNQPVRETVAVDYTPGQRIFLQLSAGSSINIRPEQVVEAFLKSEGLDYYPFAWQIHRLEMYADAAAEGDARQLITLDSMGEEMI